MDFGEKMDAIMEGIVNTLNCSHGDACGVFEAYEMTHQMDMDLSVEELVKLVCA
jgi:hypothetical protein